MWVTYAPADGAEQRWPFLPLGIKQSKAEMIEKRAGCSFAEWTTAVMAGSAKARKALLWHLMTTDHPGLRWEDVPDFAMGELVVDHDAAELAEIRKAALTAPMDEEIRTAGLAEIDTAIRDAREKYGDVDAPKVSLSNGASATPSTSLPLSG